MPSKTSSRVYSVVALLVVALSVILGREFAWWKTDDPSGSTGAVDGTTTLPIAAGQNHTTGFDAAEFYHLDQGSGIYPFVWAKALIDVETGQSFLSNPERFGLLPDAVSDFNPHGLPVGLTVGKPRGIDVEMLGLTCAACHTTQLRYNGKMIRLDGAASQFSTDLFLNRLVKSTEATFADPEKLWAFLIRLEREMSENTRVLATAEPVSPDHHAGRIHFDADTRKLLTQFERFDKLTAADSFGRTLSDHVTERVQSLAEDAEEFVSRSEHAASEAVEKLLGLDLHRDNPLSGWSGNRQRFAIESTLSTIEDSLRLLKARVEYLQAMPQLGADALPAGYGREDDFGVVRNALFGARNRRPANAPVSISPIWGTDRIAWLHWSANTTSLLGRNLGEAIGVGAAYDPETGSTSVNFPNQMRLVELSGFIVAPVWPADVFGATDAAKVERGQAIYQQRCAKCHDGGDVNESGLVELKLFLPDEIGTDPAAAEIMRVPIVNSDGEATHLATAIAQHLNEIKAAAFAEMSADERDRFEQIERRRGPVLWRGGGADSSLPTGYPAKRLEGVWATAPYLHNGSVPTLHHLLLPARQRPVSFPVGQIDFDPVHVGYELDPSRITPVPHRPQFHLDTTIPGNFNTGHEGDEFGTTLADEDRTALIEYLKVHRNPT
jgi:mono/diheme cytochrome c family protein